jgi:hypothetical protein
MFVCIYIEYCIMKSDGIKMHHHEGRGEGRSGRPHHAVERGEGEEGVRGMRRRKDLNLDCGILNPTEMQMHHAFDD